MSDCTIMSVRCVTETQPARGVLEPLFEAAVAPPDFCNNGRSGWLQSQITPKDGVGRFPCLCESSPWTLHKVDGAPLRARCVEGSSFRTFQCGMPTLPPLTTARGPFADVLVATADHFGHGFFAIVERVVNQVREWTVAPHRQLTHTVCSVPTLTDMSNHAPSRRAHCQVLYARWAGLEPYVFVGARAFADMRSCQQGLQPYYDPKHGANVWDYFFEQPGRWRPAITSLSGRHVRSLQVNPLS